MTDEIIVKEKESIKKWNKGELDLIKRTVAKGATDDEFNMFMYLAKTYQLDPILKEIWCIKYENSKTPPIIMTSRDGYLAIANRNPHYDGMISDVIHENDEFEKMPDGTVKHKYGCKNRGKIIGAYALGYRDDRKYPVYVFAPIEEYYKSSSNTWVQYTSAMMLKVPESMMLKRLISISGLVTKEEIAIEKEDGTIEVKEAKTEKQEKPVKAEPEKKPATKEQKDKLTEIIKDKGVTKEQLVWLKKVMDNGVSYDVAEKVISVWEEKKKKEKATENNDKPETDLSLPQAGSPLVEISKEDIDKENLVDDILKLSKTKNIPRETLKVWAGISKFDRLTSCEVKILEKVLDFAKKYEEGKAVV
jgi:phage recombination protein Bet